MVVFIRTFLKRGAFLFQILSHMLSREGHTYIMILNPNILWDIKVHTIFTNRFSNTNTHTHNHTDTHTLTHVLHFFSLDCSFVSAIVSIAKRIGQKLAGRQISRWLFSISITQSLHSVHNLIEVCLQLF